jgi:glycosyltransferase involved in cell wall biosynthesis
MPVPERSARLKILYHHRTASRDGQAVHIEEMASALRKRGCEVIMVEPPSTAIARFGAEAKGMANLRRFLPKALGELLEVGYNWLAYRRLKRAYLKHRPHVLYERHNLYLLAGKWLRRRFGLPYLLEVNSPLALTRSQHGGLGLPGLARRLEVSAWKAADVVLPVSGVLADMLVEQGVKRERIVVIPNGVDTAAFEAAPPRDEAKKRLDLDGHLVLGFTGFVRAWHGLDQVIDIIAEARRAELLLFVVGDGPACEALRQRARDRGVASQVRFAGLVERKDIPACLAAFDIALQPAAVPHASPLKLFEYLAAGCAVVAPRQPNLEEVLTDGENALLFSVNKAGALGEAIGRLIADSALRERLGANAKQLIVRGGYSWRRNADRVIRQALRCSRTMRARLSHQRAVQRRLLQGDET